MANKKEMKRPKEQFVQCDGCKQGSYHSAFYVKALNEYVNFLLEEKIAAMSVSDDLGEFKRKHLAEMVQYLSWSNAIEVAAENIERAKAEAHEALEPAFYALERHILSKGHRAQVSVVFADLNELHPHFGAVLSRRSMGAIINACKHFNSTRDSLAAGIVSILRGDENKIEFFNSFGTPREIEREEEAERGGDKDE